MNLLSYNMSLARGLEPNYQFWLDLTLKAFKAKPQFHFTNKTS